MSKQDFIPDFIKQDQVDLTTRMPASPPDSRCPHCGYCPHCGQSRNQRPGPYEYVPVQYPWPRPINDLPVFPQYPPSTTAGEFV